MHHRSKYRGKVIPALKAFRSLVKTVATLHEKGYVHRDIKPANVFIRNDEELVLGDFGIVYVPGASDRLTHTDERVGPRDNMPGWANIGVRLERVEPNFDIYMLGKLLWSMLDGRFVLPREYHRDAEYDFDLTQTFPSNPDMHMINVILDKCIVERASKCLPGAQELLLVVDKMLQVLACGQDELQEAIPANVCGNGLRN